MKVFAAQGQRFEVGLELFQNGQPISYHGVTFCLSPEGDLDVTIVTSWFLENTTEDTALSDLNIAKNILAELMAESAAFSSLVRGRRHRFTLIHDYGTGSIELCSLHDNKVVWAKGLPVRKEI